jgi:DNA-binding transcriptional ArsR family regulator
MPHRTVARQELADLLAVLAHPLRLAIVLELRTGEKDVTTLMHAVAASQTAVSQCLARLRAVRLVTMRRDGRHVHYSLAFPALPGWLDGGLAILEDETAQVASVHDAISQARRDLGSDVAAGLRAKDGSDLDTVTSEMT